MLAAVREAVVRRRGLEDLDLLLEHLAVVPVVVVVAVADVHAEHVRFALLGAASETAEEPAAGEDVREGVVLGEPDRMPAGEDMHQRAEADLPGALGKHRVQQQDVRDDLEAMVVEVVLGRPHGVVAETVRGLRVRDEIGIHATVVFLTVAPPVRRWPVDPGVGHVHGAVEEQAEMHRALPSHEVQRSERNCDQLVRQWRRSRRTTALWCSGAPNPSSPWLRNISRSCGSAKPALTRRPRPSKPTCRAIPARCRRSACSRRLSTQRRAVRRHWRTCCSDPRRNPLPSTC